MANLLTKSEAVLTLKERPYHDWDAEFNTFGDGINFLAMPQMMWREMGSPTSITVTVEPGDHLNPPS